jgi:phosphomethylpyrimidine synthase
MTHMKSARTGRLTPQIKKIARDEKIHPDDLLALVASGRVCIPSNRRHPRLRSIGIGKSLRTKVNVNLGTSKDFPSLADEVEKVAVSLRYGADTIMDLSTGGDIPKIRKTILARTPLPLGTVPIYQAAIEAIDKRGSIPAMTPDDLFGVIEAQAREGVDFMTLHCGRENPLYEQFDRLLDIAVKYDITLSLGDGLRPGSILDATDRPQIEELLTLGELVKRAWERDVQVMVEGPGHIPLDQVEMNVKLQKRVCHEAPFYVLGPLVTDIGAGYDHIVGAIGGALAAAAGADFLCYVTPAEHLGLPSAEDVRAGLIASRIAGHAADIVKGLPGARERDLGLSRARKALDWDGQKRLSIDPDRFEEVRARRRTKSAACSMCGDFCAMRIVSEFLGGGSGTDVSRC